MRRPASTNPPAATARLNRWIVVGLVALIRVYQRLISPILGPVCRFEPSCSRYTIACLQKYGPVRGLYRGTRRILRCHPWSAGGYDPP